MSGVVLQPAVVGTVPVHLNNNGSSASMENEPVAAVKEQVPDNDESPSPSEPDSDAIKMFVGQVSTWKELRAAS